MKYKCIPCFLIIRDTDLENGNCPMCGGAVHKMCERDHNHCGHEITEGIAYCPECSAPMCPKCECHDVEQISRVTGYLQAVDGWNAGKRQELRDRTRYDAMTGEIV